jgi:hypothetical protein
MNLKADQNQKPTIDLPNGGDVKPIDSLLSLEKQQEIDDLPDEKAAQPIDSMPTIEKPPVKATYEKLGPFG